MNIVEKCQKILRLFLFGARDALQGAFNYFITGSKLGHCL